MAMHTIYRSLPKKDMKIGFTYQLMFATGKTISTCFRRCQFIDISNCTRGTMKMEDISEELFCDKR